MLKEAYRQAFDYECQNLQGIATVELFGVTSAGSVVTPENSDPRLPFGATSHHMTCLDRDECGIRRDGTNDAPNYDWDRCPAHQSLQETRSLQTPRRHSSRSDESYESRASQASSKS